MEEWLWLCSLRGFYRADLYKLLCHFKDVGEIRRCSEGDVRQLSFLKEKQKETLMKSIQEECPEELTEKLKKEGIRFVSWQDKEYPAQLLELPDYPYGLFYKGHLPGKEEHCAAVVGARMCTNYGRDGARRIAGELARYQVSLVSGMAYGIDATAQAAHIDAGGRSYAVTGCGVDICYPKEHRRLYHALTERGGIISELPPGTQPMPLHFPMRNRLISGLSRQVIVIEAKKKSGSLITADLALEQGRDVFALPGRLGDSLSEGCNHLIAQGAGIISDIGELLSQMGYEPEKQKKKRKTHNLLASSENMVYICLDFRPRHLSEILRSADLPVQEVMCALTGLQMKGLVEEVSNNYYVRKQI